MRFGGQKMQPIGSMRLIAKSSKRGYAVAAIFLFVAICVFSLLFYSSSTNPADSGEGGILLLFFAVPWINMMPSGWIGPFSAMGCILLNALLLYCVFGGLRLEKKP